MTGTLVWLAAPVQDLLDIAIAEIDAAIALVSSGAATRIRLVGIAAAADVAPTGAAHAQAAAVAFRISRGAAGLPTIEIGPRIAATEATR